MEVKRLRELGLQIFKTLNELNSVFIEGIFHRTEWFTFRKNTHTHTHTHTHKMQVNFHKTTKYGDECLSTFGPHIWNLLPEPIKPEFNFIEVKYINQSIGK